MVKFTIQSPVSGEAQLEVYNQLGQRVDTILEDMYKLKEAR